MPPPRLLTAAVLTAAVAACATEVPLSEAEPGAPLPEATEAELLAFREGHALFNRPFAPEDGLGPIFNQTRCSSCHDLPTSGGHGAEPVTKASRYDPATGCSLLEAEGGDLLQASVVPALSALGIRPERTPAGATEITRVRAPALYGLGLVEAVPEADVLAREDPDDRDGDGVSGRAARTAGGAVGRFGGKGQDATLHAFVASAAGGELGLTTLEHPTEHLPNGEPLPEGVDPLPEPELGAEQLAALVAYVRMLAPPAARVPENGGAADARRGARLFEEVGCATCHTPTMVTGPSASAALDRKRFRIYSDLLLHDLGGTVRDVCGPDAAPEERLTARLVGLSLRHDYMHDASANSLQSAVRLHGGEATRSRDAFDALGEAEKALIYAFLGTL